MAAGLTKGTQGLEDSRRNPPLQMALFSVLRRATPVARERDPTCALIDISADLPFC